MAADVEDRGVAIPPTREAVQAAMRTKKRPPSPGITLLVFCAIGALGFFVLPRLGKVQEKIQQAAPPVIIIDPVYGETRKHASSIRLLVSLPPSSEGQARSELAGDLIFTFAADHEDFDKAEEAIRTNWDAGAAAMRDIVSQYSRREHLRDRVKIFTEMRAALDERFFPQGSGRIAQLEWLELNLQ
ncbi:MAG: hypothetical protein ACYTG5_07980 [Planctomycetota bacterium]|jgi:hypothetical protein